MMTCGISTLPSFQIVVSCMWTVLGIVQSDEDDTGYETGRKSHFDIRTPICPVPFYRGKRVLRRDHVDVPSKTWRPIIVFNNISGNSYQYHFIFNFRSSTWSQSIENLGHSQLKSKIKKIKQVKSRLNVFSPCQSYNLASGRYTFNETKQMLRVLKFLWPLSNIKGYPGKMTQTFSF